MSSHTYTKIPTHLLIVTGAVIFLANAGLLVLQIVGNQLLKPFIYSTVETWTSIIGVFLTGIALGNWFGGRIADRFPTPKAVGVVLIVSGIAALGMIGCYEWTLKSGFHKSIGLGVRIPLLAFMFCLLPAFFLSLLTPLTIKLLLPDVGSAGRIAGLIFSLSTVGCLFGNYFTGFWLTYYLSLNQITMCVGIGLMLLSVPVFLLKMSREEVVRSDAPPSATANDDEPSDGGWDFRNKIHLAYGVVFIASFCGMSLELTASRVLAPILGVSLFTWTGIIGVMLAGTACGNYLGGILADRGVGPAVRRFAVILAVLAGAAAGPVVARHLVANFNPQGKDWIDYGTRAIGAVIAVLCVLPGLWLSRSRRGAMVLIALVGGLIGLVLAHSLGRAIDDRFTGNFFENLANKPLGAWILHGLGFALGASIAVMFVWDAPPEGERPTRSGALSGSLFSAAMMTLSILLLMGVFTHYNPSEPAEPGFMYCDGDIVQQVLAWTFGLFFLPMLILGTISPQVIRLSIPNMASAGRVAGSVYAWSTAGAIVGTFATGYFLISLVGTFRVIMVLTLILASLAFVVGRLWKNNVMLYAASVVCGGAIFGLLIIDYGSNLYDKETKYYAIKVENRGGLLWLRLDNLTHSVVHPDDPTWLGYEHEYIQGELLLLAQAKNEETNLLVIGGGGYTFPRYAEHYWPDVNIDVIEIDPGVTQIAYEKLGLSRDTKIRSINMDGRQFITERAKKGHYNLVMQDAVNDLSVPGHLMTLEYNRAIKETLAPGGAYLLTFIDSLRTGLFWRAAINTMKVDFKYVYLLSPSEFYEWGTVVEDGKEVTKPVISDRRHVCIIYGSDQPLDFVQLEVVTRQFVANELRKRENAVAMVSPLPLAVPQPEVHPDGRPNNGIAGEIDKWMLKTYTHVLDNEELDLLLDEKKHRKIILTDQYCPVDNLMAEIFRESKRGRKR